MTPGNHRDLDMDWTEERQATLAKARRIVVKVGSAVLTSRDGLDLDVVRSLASQLAALHDQGRDVVLVSSGAVAAGRCVFHGPDKGHCRHLKNTPERQAAAAIGQSRLMHAYDQALADLGKVTAQILLTRDDFQRDDRFRHACDTFDALLAWRVLPIVNENDTVSVEELVGDNDMLSSLLLNLVEADLYVNLTSAPGVLASRPDQDPTANVLPCIENIEELDLDQLCGGKTSVGTGGMFSKLLAARRASQIGVSTIILPGREPEALSRAFAGEGLGTWIRARAKHVSRRKFRLAYNARPAGNVLVDQGAARALTAGGKSLLAAGIVDLEGDFEAGSLVRIVTQAGEARHTVGVGLINYRADELRRILGRKTHEYGEVLGDVSPGRSPEIVHRDNMLLDAALCGRPQDTRGLPCALPSSWACCSRSSSWLAACSTPSGAWTGPNSGSPSASSASCRSFWPRPTA